LRALLFDPQTSGGLLISVESTQARVFVDKLQQVGLNAAKIGTVLEPYRQDGKIWAIQLV
jgi:selenophosphate synthase